MHVKWHALVLMLVLGSAAVMASACAASTSFEPTPTPVPPDEQQAIDAALADARQRLNVGASDVHLDQVEARQWPDASLGCPRPSELAAQVITPGFLVMISGAGKQLEYHTDSRGRVALCAER